MRTQGFVLKAIGPAAQAFELREIELPALQPNEVLIESEAFGLNYADVMARLGLYREAPPMPCVLGYELVGRVTEVGAGVATEWVGKRVLAFTRFGAYAKHAITTINALVDIADLPAHEALPFATQGVTAYYMAEILSPLEAHDNVLVHAAAGGVGSLLVQLAKRKGAKVVAKIGSEQKTAYVKSLGADEVILYKQTDYAQAVATFFGPTGLTASFNAVGGASAKKDLKMLGPGGRLFLFGGADLATRKGLLGKISFLWDMGLVLPVGLMMQSKNLLGVNMLKLADANPELIQKCMECMLKLYSEKAIQLPLVTSYKISEFAAAHEALGGGQTSGKMVIYWN